MGGVIKFVFITITILLLLEFLWGKGFYYRTYGSWIIQKGKFWHYWYFASMLLIYLISPLLSRLMNSKYLLLSLFILCVFCILIFYFDYTYEFEKKYIIQTFRLWYWIFYFLLGGCIHKYKKMMPHFSWRIALGALGINTIIITSEFFGYMAIEYYFGGLFCILCSVCVFIACLNTKIEDKKSVFVVSELSRLFLPVYAMHTFLIKSGVVIIGVIPNQPHFTFFINYIGICVYLVIISMAIMRIPYVNKIFKL